MVDMADASTPGAFIPHDTVVSQPRPQAQSGGLNDLVFLLAIVLLVASGALAVGVFLYGQYLQNESTSQLAQLQRAEAAFDPSLIQQITRLDDRMRAASAILSGHLAPTAFFQALDQSTLQTVSFQTLDLEAPDPQHITVKMQGVAQSVNSIALQANLFSQGGVIVSPIFSNIAREADGVHFDLTADVNPASLEYSALIQNAVTNASAQPQTQTQTTTQTQTPTVTPTTQQIPAPSSSSVAPSSVPAQQAPSEPTSATPATPFGTAPQPSSNTAAPTNSAQ